MKRFIIAAVALAATAALAQQTAPGAGQQKIVAVINGEVLTQQKLNDLYYTMSPQVREQYEARGGKAAFLDNYIRKRLVVQEAMKTGFDKRPDVQTALEMARESALFDKYVRDVIGSQVVTDAEAKKYYDEHPSEFATKESIKAYHIVLLTSGANAMTKAQATERIQRIAKQIRDDVAATHTSDPAAASRVLLSFFKNAARQYSQDGSAPSGGDLGWLAPGQVDASFEQAAFAMKPGTMSDPVQSQFGEHLIYVEAKRPAGTTPFDDVKASIRERLLADHTSDIMAAVQRLTGELQATGKVSVQSENIN